MDDEFVRGQPLPEGLSSERRACIRFPVSLDVRYRVAGSGLDVNGSGRTIDMSSSGLKFTADRPLSVGQKVELSIDWPVRLDGQIQLQLVTSGVVVRTSGAVIALRIERHEFRTQRARLSVARRQELVGLVG
jgi:hypothetical protein